MVDVVVGDSVVVVAAVVVVVADSVVVVVAVVVVGDFVVVANGVVVAGLLVVVVSLDSVHCSAPSKRILVATGILDVQLILNPKPPKAKKVSLK